MLEMVVARKPQVSKHLCDQEMNVVPEGKDPLKEAVSKADLPSLVCSF